MHERGMASVTHLLLLLAALQTLTQQPAGVIRDLCQRSIVARRSWCLAACAAQLSSQLSTGAGVGPLGLQQTGSKGSAGIPGGGDSALELSSCPTRSRAAANWRRAASLVLRSQLRNCLKELQAFQVCASARREAPLHKCPNNR